MRIRYKEGSLKTVILMFCRFQFALCCSPGNFHSASELNEWVGLSPSLHLLICCLPVLIFKSEAEFYSRIRYNFVHVSIVLSSLDINHINLSFFVKSIKFLVRYI